MPVYQFDFTDWDTLTSSTEEHILENDEEAEDLASFMLTDCVGEGHVHIYKLEKVNTVYKKGSAA